MTAINHLNNVANTSELPTVNNATLTIQRNGTTVDTFTANDATNTTANIAAVTSVATGGGLTGGTITNTGTISHADTSSQGTISNNGQFINGLTLDTYGHVTGFTRAAAGGGTPGQTATGSYVLMQGTRSNFAYGPGQTVAPTGDGRERYGCTFGRSTGSGSGDFQQRTSTAQGSPISGGTWRGQSHGVTNQYAVNLMVRIS